MLKVSRVLIAKGVTLPEWAYDFWAYVLNEIQRTHLVIQRDFESRGECGIYIDTFFKKRGIEIPLSKVLLRSKADWAGHADYRKEVLMCKVDEDLFKKLEAGSSIHTLMNKYRGTFFHELGHLLDKSIQYKDPKGLKYPERGFEGSYGVHAKFPTEWRAYAAEIQGDLYERSRWDFAQGDETIADYLGANSPEWNARERYLPPEGRRYILEIFAKILLKDPGYFSKSVPLEKIHPFKSLGQFVTVAVHIQNSPQVPFHNFLIDQLEDIPEEVTDPFKLDIQWVNYRMDFLYDVYDREKPRILNSWIKHLNKMIDETPVESPVIPCKPLKKYVVGLFMDEAKVAFPMVFQTPYKPIQDDGFGKTLMNFVDGFCARHNTPYWQNTLEDAFWAFRKKLKQELVNA